jgi:hypothetical protein
VSYFVDRMGERTHQRSVSKAGPVRPARWGSAALASPKAGSVSAPKTYRINGEKRPF